MGVSPASLSLEPGLLRPKRADTAAAVPNLERELADEILALGYRFIVVATLHNDGSGENLAALINLIKSVVGHDGAPVRNAT
jgi:hypothetical protein